MWFDLCCKIRYLGRFLYIFEIIISALCASATSVDRRRQLGSGSVPGLRRQPGIKSTSNLKLHEKLNPPHKTAMEAPEARATPRYVSNPYWF